MTTAVSQKDSVEGMEVQGTSRAPLRMKMPENISGIRCTVLTTEQDVNAEVIDGIPPDTSKLIASSFSDRGDELHAQKVKVYTLLKQKKALKGQSVQPTTGTHKAHHWIFNRQTAIKIIHSRTELINAVEKKKRELIESSKTAKKPLKDRSSKKFS